MDNAHEPLEDVLAEQADSGLDDAPDIDVVGAIADLVAHPRVLRVFALSEPGNILKVLRGDDMGTVLHP